MKRIVKNLIQFTIHHDWILILFLLLGSLFLISKVPYLNIKADNEVLLNKDSSAYQNYDAFSQQFSSDRLLIALFEGDIFDTEHLETIKNFSDEVVALNGVKETVGIANAEGFKRTMLAIETFPIYERWQENNESLAWFAEALKSNHFINKNCLSKEGQAALIVIVLGTELNEKTRNMVVFRVQDLVKKHSSRSLKASLAGVPLEEYLFLNNINSDQRILVPVIFICLAIMCLVFFKGWSAFIAALGSILLTILWMQGTVVWCGRFINPITSLLSPVVMVVSLAHIVHIMNHISEHKEIARSNVQDVLLDAISKIGVPAFLASVTTSVGFFSLMVSDNPAIQEFGFFAGIASLYSFVISLGLSIVVIKRMGVYDQRIVIRFPSGLLRGLGRILVRFKKSVFLLGMIISGLLIYRIVDLRVDTKLINYLKDKDAITHSIEVIDNKFYGSNSLEIVMTLKEGTFFDQENFLMLHNLSLDLKTIPRLKEVNGFNDLLMNIHQVLDRKDKEPLPSERRLKLYHQKMKEQNNEKLYKFITKDFQTAQLNCLLLNSSTKEILTVKKAVEDKLNALSTNKFSYYITGRDYLFADMSDTLVKGQIQTMIWAGVPISLMVFLSLMSFRLGMAGVFAMGLPIVMTYGIMGLRGIPLNTATTMISSVAMGLLVDDTIHFLYRFKRERSKKGATLQQSVETTLQLTGKAIVITSIILMVGFSVGIIGSVVPTIHFSLMMGLAAFLSLLINIIFLPITLLLVTPVFGSKKLAMKRKEDLTYAREV